MQWLPTEIPEVVLIAADTHRDDRGFFRETWNRRVFAEHDLDVDFVQDNHSHSRHGVLRGLHYQVHRPQGKLVQVLSGEIFDVAVDLRGSAATFGKWIGRTLSAGGDMIWVPQGFAHGFLVLSAEADVVYKCTDFYAPEHERTLRWDDPDLKIHWPLQKGESPQLSPKDAAGTPFKQAETYP